MAYLTQSELVHEHEISDEILMCLVMMSQNTTTITNVAHKGFSGARKSFLFVRLHCRRVCRSYSFRHSVNLNMATKLSLQSLQSSMVETVKLETKGAWKHNNCRSIVVLSVCLTISTCLLNFIFYVISRLQTIFHTNISTLSTANSGSQILIMIY